MSHDFRRPGCKRKLKAKVPATEQVAGVTEQILAVANLRRNARFSERESSAKKIILLAGSKKVGGGGYRKNVKIHLTNRA